MGNSHPVAQRRPLGTSIYGTYAISDSTNFKTTDVGTGATRSTAKTFLRRGYTSGQASSTLQPCSATLAWIERSMVFEAYCFLVILYNTTLLDWCDGCVNIATLD